MRKVTMPNFYINFLNKTVKSLSILCDFAVASYMDAWIKILGYKKNWDAYSVASYMDAWIKIILSRLLLEAFSRILHGCVD